MPDHRHEHAPGICPCCADDPLPTIDRRRWLALTASTAIAAAAVPFAARTAAAATPHSPLLPPGPRSLGFVHLHTNERLRVTYFRDGAVKGEALDAINRFLRDWRTDDVIDIDVNTLDTLWLLRQKMGVDAPYGLISGYRSPATNARLAAAGRGVAQRSLHMVGRAIDVRLPGIQPKALADAALALNRGGVGLYRRSGFVHVDSGPVRRWGF